jgi:hypothetical protein
VEVEGEWWCPSTREVQGGEQGSAGDPRLARPIDTIAVTVPAGLSIPHWVMQVPGRLVHHDRYRGTALVHTCSLAWGTAPLDAPLAYVGTEMLLEAVSTTGQPAELVRRLLHRLVGCEGAVLSASPIGPGIYR